MAGEQLDTPRSEAEVKAEALREAADSWTQGGWSDVMLPKPTPPAVPVIAYSNRMGDWLRARAAELAEPEPLVHDGDAGYFRVESQRCPECGPEPSATPLTDRLREKGHGCA